MAARPKKVMLRTWDNHFDWWSLFIIFIGAVFQFCIYTSIVMTFKVAIQAELNIGIAQCIWAITPFFISVIDRVFYHRAIDSKAIWGMSLIVFGAIFISLSEVFKASDPDSPEVVTADEDKTPVWVAILVSFCPPTFFSLNIFVVLKYVNETLKIDAMDFAVAYWGMASAVYQIFAIFYFLQVEDSFDWGLWVNGSIASLLNLIGGIFSICAYATMAPPGPSTALIGNQTIIVIIVSAVMLGKVPSGLQIIGLIFGILGSLVLTVFKEMKAFV